MAKLGFFTSEIDAIFEACNETVYLAVTKKTNNTNQFATKTLDQFNQTQIGFGNYTNAFGDLQNYGVITDPGIRGVGCWVSWSLGREPDGCELVIDTNIYKAAKNAKTFKIQIGDQIFESKPNPYFVPDYSTKWSDASGYTTGLTSAKEDNIRVIMMDLAMYKTLKSFQGQNVKFRILWD